MFLEYSGFKIGEYLKGADKDQVAEKKNSRWVILSEQENMFLIQ